MSTATPDTLEGRKLDAEIHRRVFDFPWTTAYAPETVPAYSTDPAAMLQVVEKMHAAHHVVSIMWHTDNEIRCEIDDACAVADSAPLAVSRAALLAVAQEVK